MPWTLYRYILRELLKIMAIVVLVLVTMVSFAAAIKPISEGLLGAGALLKFVGYSAPTMLGFTLPFAGAFASTLVFIRMAGDNEVLACSASGMSYAKVLAPVAALGLVLTMGLFYLSNFVVPGFYRAAEETLEKDMMSVLVTQLNQNRPFTEFDGIVIYADSAQQYPPPSIEGAENASKFIQLAGVAVGELDEQEQVRADSTARFANILLFQDERESRVTLKLIEAMRYQPKLGELEYFESLPVGPIVLPSPFGDSPKYLSWPELRELDREPERYSDVQESKTQLIREVAVAELRTSIRQRLKADRGRAGVVLTGATQDYLVKSPIARTVGGVLKLESRPGRPITIDYPAQAPQRRIEALAGQIEVNASEQQGTEPSVSIELREVSVFNVPDAVPTTEMLSHQLPPMRWSKPILEENIDKQPIAALEAYAAPHLSRSKHVDNALESLNKNIRRLGRKIVSQLHERAASAVNCLMLLVFGATLAMKLKGHLPLAVFIWSFMLAIVSIMLIHTGENISVDGSGGIPVGLGVLWSGNVGMAVLTLLVYRSLARN